MAVFDQRKLGIFLIAFSILLIIILTSIKIDVDRQGEFTCELVSKNPSLDMSECPAHKSNISWLIVLAFGIAFMIFVSGVYLILLPRINISVSNFEQKTQEFKRLDAGKLDEEEKKIYDIIKQKEGSIYQSDLVRESGLSKVRVTRILDRLVTKGIVERNRRGMTNIIILK